MSAAEATRATTVDTVLPFAPEPASTALVLLLTLASVRITLAGQPARQVSSLPYYYSYSLLIQIFQLALTVDGGLVAIKRVLAGTMRLATRCLGLARAALAGGETIARSLALRVTMASIARRAASVRTGSAATPSPAPAPARAAGWAPSATSPAPSAGTAPTAPPRASARMREAATQRLDTASASLDGR